MIEFNGYLYGKAEKQYWKNIRKYGYRVLLFAFIGTMPLAVFIISKFKMWEMSIVVGFTFLSLFLLLFLLPKTKEKKSMIPKRIFTDGEFITCIAEKYADNKRISDVKKVYDYDEYYNIIMTGGSGLFMYVCQKDLLSEGTLSEFEALFEGKIIDMKDRTGDGSAIE